jgi:nicotinamidase-related amidase
MSEKDKLSMAQGATLGAAPDDPVLKVPLSVEGPLGATWDSLDRLHHQRAIGIATAKSALARARDAGHLVIHDSIVHSAEDAKDPTPGEPRHASLLHWALMTHDLTCALGHLASMASRIPRGMVTSLTERPILDLAVAAVAFTIQLTIETEDRQDALELRALERKLIASMDRRDG